MKRAGLLLVLILAANCADSRGADHRVGRSLEILTPTPPPFLSGPAAVLLTNTGGFSAHVVMETGSPSDKSATVTGELLGRGNKLLFATETKTSSSKRSGAGGFSFIWDVSANRGYAISEALQGYAPVASNVQVTNLVVRASQEQAAPAKIEGHPCDQEEAVIDSNDGSVAAIRVWRATDLHGFPIRIAQATNATALTVSFSKIRIETQPDELFLPPDGFTKYDTVDAMMNELAVRQQAVRQSTTRQPGRAPEDGMDDVQGRRGRGYGGGY